MIALLMFLFPLMYMLISMLQHIAPPLRSMPLSPLPHFIFMGLFNMFKTKIVLNSIFLVTIYLKLQQNAMSIMLHHC